MAKFVTDTSGNSRGNLAVDTQFVRLSADQVASGYGSTILAGENNKATGTFSTILGGSDNEVTGAHSIAVGNQNLVNGEYVILYGNNNEIRRDSVFFGGDNNIFDTSINANGSAHIFGLGTESYDNGDGNFYTVLAARNFSIGSIATIYDAASKYSAILGGLGGETLYTHQTVRNSYVFPKLAGTVYGTTRVQESSILFDSKGNHSINIAAIPQEYVPLKNDGEARNLPFFGQYIDASTGGTEQKYSITVNWIVSEVDTINMRTAVGVDHIVLWRRSGEPIKLMVNNISKIGDLASVVTPVYTLIDPDGSSLTPTTTMFSYFTFNQNGTYRAGAQFRILEDRISAS